MAVNRAATFEAMTLVAGSKRWIAARFGVAVLAGLPGMLAARAALGASAASRPWFTEAPDPLPVIRFARMLRELGPAMPALAAGVAVAFLAQLLLTAAAVELFDPRRAGTPVRLWRRTFDTGTRFLWVYLRIVALAAVALGVGGRIVALAFERLADHGDVAGWTGLTLLIRLPVARVAVLLVLAGVVGTVAAWARVVVVADGRRLVRRTVVPIVRALARRGFQGLVVPMVVGTASLLAGAAVLFAWRQAPGPGTVGFVAWFAVLLVQAYLAHWRLRLLCLLWAAPEMDDVRRTPDEPWHVFRRLARKLVRRRRPIAAEPGAGSVADPTSPPGTPPAPA